MKTATEEMNKLGWIKSIYPFQLYWNRDLKKPFSIFVNFKEKLSNKNAYLGVKEIVQRFCTVNMD